MTRSPVCRNPLFAGHAERASHRCARSGVSRSLHSGREVEGRLARLKVRRYGHVLVNHAPLAADLAVDVGYPQPKRRLLTAFQCPADPLEFVAVAKGRVGGDDEIAEVELDRPFILFEESL